MCEVEVEVEDDGRHRQRVEGAGCDVAAVVRPNAAR